MSQGPVSYNHDYYQEKSETKGNLQSTAELSYYFTRSISKPFNCSLEVNRLLSHSEFV